MKPLKHPLLAGPGRRTPRELLAIDERDHFLRAAADRFCAGMSDRAAGEMLRTKLLRYRSGAWRRDASEARCPPRHRGTINELLWMTLKARDRLLSTMTIRRTLAIRDPRDVIRFDHRSSDKGDT